MSKSPKRPASSRKPAKPVTIELEANKADDAKAAKAAAAAQAKKDATSRRSTPKVGRDAGKSAPAQPAAKTEAPSAKATKDAELKNTEPKTGQSDANKPAADAKRSASQQPSGGTGGRIAAGLVGGLLALGGGAGLQAAGYLPSFGQPVSAEYAKPSDLEQTRSALSAKIAALEEKLANAAVVEPAMDRATLDSIIDARIGQGSVKADPELVSKMLDIENRTISLETSIGDNQEKLAALSSGLANAANDTANGPDVEAVQGFSDKLDIVAGDVARLKQEVAGEIAKEGVNPETVIALGTTVAGLQKQIGDLAGRVESVSAKAEQLPETMLGANAVDERIANAKSAMDESVSGVRSSLQEVTTNLTEQQAALTSLQQQVDNGADKRAAKALIAAQLKNQLDRGEPFAEALQTLKTVSGEADAYAELEPFAETGIATIAQLSNQFDAVGEAIINRLTPTTEMSLSERLLSGAKSLVKVKPIGAVEGDSPEAIVSRIDAGLRSGDAAQASQAWQTLPDAGKQVSQSWHDTLQARLSADNLMNTTVQNFISSTVSN